MYDIILKKRNGEKLNKAQIQYVINGYVAGEIPDYQVAALLMAIYFKGMDAKETADLTMTMVDSGEQIDLSSIAGIKVDKHSTGGVADTTTLIVAPLVAACGVPVAKMSGRGLGHTGGTIDKLETIAGFNVEQPKDAFIRIVNEIGVAVVGQTGILVPADKKLYALRDVTATVDNISLIASSIMSKKIASGADAFVLDVKAGNGAFMTETEKAFELAKEMVAIGTHVGKRTIAIVTDMNEPLGMAIGNALEVKEAIEILSGMHKEGALREISLQIGAYMLLAAQKCQTVEEGIQILVQTLESGKGLVHLKKMITAQGGDSRVVDNPSLLPQANHMIEVKTQQEGWIFAMDTQDIGSSAMLIGAGRKTKEDKIDLAVGIVMEKRIGEYVKQGETIAKFYVNEEKMLDEAIDLFKRAVHIKEQKPSDKTIVYGVVDSLA